MPLSQSQLKLLARFKVCLSEWIDYMSKTKALANTYDELATDNELTNKQGAKFLESQEAAILSIELSEAMKKCIWRYQHEIFPQLQEIAKKMRFMIAEIERTEAKLDNGTIFQATHAVISWPMVLNYILQWGRAIQLELDRISWLIAKNPERKDGTSTLLAGVLVCIPDIDFDCINALHPQEIIMTQKTKKRSYASDYDKYLPSIVDSLDKIMRELKYGDDRRINACEKLVSMMGKDSTACKEKKFRQAAKQILSSDSLAPVFPSSVASIPDNPVNESHHSTSEIESLFPSDH